MKKLYALLFVLPGLLMARPASAQSADIPRRHASITGLNDPEPASPRYLKASELARLQESASQQAEQARPAAPAAAPEPLTGPSHALPTTSVSLRKQ